MTPSQPIGLKIRNDSNRNVEMRGGVFKSAGARQHFFAYAPNDFFTRGACFPISGYLLRCELAYLFGHVDLPAAHVVVTPSGRVRVA
jgi:hypothetical protein